jgi:hypothetical protein
MKNKIIATAAISLAMLTGTAHAHGSNHWVGPFLGGLIIGQIYQNHPPVYYPQPPVIVMQPQQPIRQAPTIVYPQRDGTCIEQRHDPYTNRVETFRYYCGNGQ